MKLDVGDWVELPDLAIARIVEISGAPPMVRAERPRGGGTTRMPLSFALARWRPVPRDGLRVAWATAPTEVASDAKSDPISLVARALVDAGGAATSRDLKEILERVIGRDAFVAWWKRTQRRLETDDRIDTSEALQHRYRLVRPGKRPSVRLRPLLSNRTRNGRVLADGPRLLDARERAKSKKGITDEELAELETVADLARNEKVDPTDRFLAAEIPVLHGARSHAELAEVVGADVLDLDLLRVREHDSRTRAVALVAAWVAAHPRESDDPIPAIASAIAVGDPWATEALEVARTSEIPILSAVGWAIRWAAPGSVEAGVPDYPKDLERYVRRVSSLRARAAGAPAGGEATFQRAVLGAMDVLCELSQQGSLWRDAMTEASEAFWDVARRSESSGATTLRHEPPRGAGTWVALVDAAPSDTLTTLDPILEDAYIRDQASVDALRMLAQREGRDFRAVLVGVAIQIIATSRARAAILDALHVREGSAKSENDALALAGAIWSEHPDIASRLESSAEAAINELITGEPADGKRLFLETLWRRAVAVAHEHVAEQGRTAQAALERLGEAELELRQAREASERRREALQESRATTTSQSTSNTRTLGVNLYKPVAAALSDSFESQSLAALQDRLLSALVRLKVEQIGSVGDVIEFDPRLHVWVGTGSAESMVRVVAPGYVARIGEGDDELVLTPARVT